VLSTDATDGERAWEGIVGARRTPPPRVLTREEDSDGVKGMRGLVVGHRGDAL
jgi:hypothetical protein